MSNFDDLNIFQEIHQEFMGLVGRIPENERETPIFDMWSLKQMLAHISAWNNLTADHVEDLLNDREIKWVSDNDEFNKHQVEKRSHLDYEKTFQDLQDSVNRVVTLYSDLSQELWDKPCGPGDKFTPRIWLKGIGEHYLDEHIPQLKKYLA